MNCLNCGVNLFKNKKFCSNSCQKEFEYTNYIKNWKSGKENGLRGNYQTSMYIKTYLLKNIIINVANVVGEKRILILKKFH